MLPCIVQADPAFHSCLFELRRSTNTTSGKDVCGNEAAICVLNSLSTDTDLAGGLGYCYSMSRLILKMSAPYMYSLVMEKKIAMDIRKIMGPLLPGSELSTRGILVENYFLTILVCDVLPLTLRRHADLTRTLSAARESDLKKRYPSGVGLVSNVRSLPRLLLGRAGESP
jgi:hypothetical protein